MAHSPTVTHALKPNKAHRIPFSQVFEAGEVPNRLWYAPSQLVPTELAAGEPEDCTQYQQSL